MQWRGAEPSSFLFLDEKNSREKWSLGAPIVFVSGMFSMGSFTGTKLIVNEEPRHTIAYHCVHPLPSRVWKRLVLGAEPHSPYERGCTGPGVEGTNEFSGFFFWSWPTDLFWMESDLLR
jgi:hypothetical protein